MPRFNTVVTGLDMKRFADPNRPENNVSINDAIRLQVMIKNMRFPEVTMYCGSNTDGGRGIPFDEMRNIGADFDFPIDIRMVFPGKSSEVYVTEVIRNVDKPNWAAFQQMVIYFETNPSRLDEGTDYIGHAFQKFPELETSFMQAFGKLNF